jgi:glycosyltransferase involved in cell wall biosynthesis
MTSARRPLRVLHVITRMITGGAQENTLVSCALIDGERFPSEILCGPETGIEGDLHEETRSRGVVMHFEPSLVRAPHPWKDLVAIARLRRFMARGRYDVVHTHTSKAGIVGRIAAWLAGTPVVVHTAHGWGFNRKQSPPVYAFYVITEWVCARLCHALVVVSEPTRRDALRKGIGRPEQYHLIRSGIEIEPYRDVSLSCDEARARLGLPAVAFVVGSVGRLGEQKAPLDLIAAFERLARSHSDSILVLVGDGELRRDVEADVARRGLADRVKLLGQRRDVPEILRACDAFALASHWEGLPRVFPQAMAAGLPIVATDVDGAADAIVHGESGFLVRIGDTAALGDRLIELAQDRERARRMGACGRARVDEFSARRMVDQLAELYEWLARERGVS